MLSDKEIQEHRNLFSETDRGMVAAFKVLSDINRYRIFTILSQQPKISIGNIAKILDISLPLASQHLKILEKTNILQKLREGKTIYPTLEHSNPFVQAIVSTIQMIKQNRLSRRHFN